MGDSESREDLGREPRDLGAEAGQGRCGDHAADGAGEVVGDTDHGRLASGLDAGSGGEAAGGGQGDIEQADGGMGDAELQGFTRSSGAGNGESEVIAEGYEDSDGERKIKCEMGGSSYESSPWMDLSQLSGLGDSELAEIREWMVKSDNRTDELRLLGNGVVPATAERAFRVLLNEVLTDTK